MKVRQKVYDSPEDTNPLVTEIPVDYFNREDSVRIGFNKGTLKEVSFILHDGKIITYEKVEE